MADLPPISPRLPLRILESLKRELRTKILSQKPPKPEKLGMGKLAVAFAVLLFLIQLVPAMFGVQSFVLGAIFEGLIILLLVYGLWVWEGTHGISLWWKLLSSVAITLAIVLLLWSPAKKQYRREHALQSVLSMQAHMVGIHGANAGFTQFDLDVDNAQPYRTWI